MREADREAILNQNPVDAADVRAAMSRIPSSWNLVMESEDGGAFRRGNVYVIFTVEKHEDRELWLHVSVSSSTGHTPCLPSWEDLKRAKNDFIGIDKWAYQVLPEEKEYVNINPHVLHLYARFRGTRALPDFTYGSGSL